MGDLSRFRLLLTGEELARAKRVASGQAGAVAAAASGAGGGGASQSAAAERDALQDALSTRLAQYYGSVPSPFSWERELLLVEIV